MYNEFIGFTLEVADSKNSSLIGKKGKIIDETKYLIIIEQANDNIVKILKSGTTFIINEKKVNGDKIIKRPEDRIKLIKKY